MKLLGTLLLPSMSCKFIAANPAAFLSGCPDNLPAVPIYTPGWRELIEAVLELYVSYPRTQHIALCLALGNCNISCVLFTQKIHVYMYT